MKFRIDKEEKELVMKFQNMRIPSLFKTDNTDRILFVEDVSFFIVKLLLKGRKISKTIYDETMVDYERFVINTDVSKLDEYTLEYFNTCIQVMETIKKYYL